MGADAEVEPEAARRLNIQIDPHTLERANERGVGEEKILDVIETGFPIPARCKRLGKGQGL